MSTDLLVQAVSDASEMGFRTVSISGGEPLLFRDLGILLSHAKLNNMRTTLTSNGTLLNSKKLSEVKSDLDLLAVSLDGPAELHNAIRGSDTAFDFLRQGLPGLTREGIRFGIIHTLTRSSWEHLFWLADFASANGADLLQIHPLELNGRASYQMTTDSLTDADLSRAYLLGLILAAKYAGKMAIQVDLVAKDLAARDPEYFYSSELDLRQNTAEPAELLSPIIIEATGSVVPLSSGFSKAFEICNLKRMRLRDAWQIYRENKYLEFRNFCRNVFQNILEDRNSYVFNWHDIVRQRSLASFGEEISWQDRE